MRKNVLLVAVVFLFALPLALQAEPVIYGRTETSGKNGAVKSGASASDNGDLSRRIGSLAKRTGDLAEGLKNNTGAVDKLTTATDNLTIATEKDVAATKAVDEKVGAVGIAAQKKSVEVGNNLGEQGQKNTWVLAGLIALILVMVVIVYQLLRGRLNSIDTAVAVINTNMTAVGSNVVAARNDISAIPSAVHSYFDRSDLDVVVFGHHVVFTQTEEVLDRKAYQVLKVEKGVDPAVTVATHQFHEISDRRVAIDSLKRTMREYFNGRTKWIADEGGVDSNTAKLTLALIKELSVPGGRLSITKL